MSVPVDERDTFARTSMRLVERDMTCPLCGAYPHAKACPSAWPPPMDRALRQARAMLGLAMFAGALVYYLRAPLPLYVALPLAVILASLIVGVLLLAEAAPSKGPGRVTGRSTRR